MIVLSVRSIFRLGQFCLYIFNVTVLPTEKPLTTNNNIARIFRSHFLESTYRYFGLDSIIVQCENRKDVHTTE